MKTILVVAALGSLLLCGCSTEARVKTITGGKHVTRYADQPWKSFDGLFRDTGDQKVGDHGYKFKLVASMVTSQEQTYDLAMVHAADLTMTSGYSHFVIVSRKVGVLCGGYGAYVSGNTFSGNPTTHADPQVSMEIEMMNEADKGGVRKVFEAEKVMRDLGLKVDRPDSSSEGRARAYLANANTCRTGHPTKPSQVSLGG